MDAQATPLRPVRLGHFEARAEHRQDGTILVRSAHDLAPYPRSIVDALEAWARRTPDAILIADRDGDSWRKLSFADVLARLPPLAQALLDADLSADRPLLILSGNEIEHLLLGLAAHWVGIPYAPVSPTYSLVSTDYGKLRHIVQLLTPGMVYASDGARFGPAIAATIAGDVPLIVRQHPPEGRIARRFDDLLATPVTDAVAKAHAAIKPDDVAKFLFTSGSTGLPKGVITTHRMMACNQEMIRSALAFFADEPPVLLDWMPWNHVAGGSHNIGHAIYNGGALYIDDGAPVPGRFDRTIRNLKEVAPTYFTNVPKAYELLVAALDTDADLRRNFFSRLKLMQYAGASLPQHVFDGLERAARAELGERVMIITGYGSTETAPFAFTTTWPVQKAGHIGLPAPGMSVKLVPNEGKLEVRLKGPNVTPGYWRAPELTAAAFDDEGYYRIGDAIRFIDPSDVNKGFVFDGRVSEDFKLSTGTWVNFAALRTAVISACAPLIRDVVLTGLDRNFIGALIFPDLAACCRLAGLPADTKAADVVAHPTVRETFAQCLRELAEQATGSSVHVARALLMADAPDIDKGEVTDKGSINQRAVQAARAKLVEALYAASPSPDILILPRRGE
jgi:feruloyl-CoA synthase